jgi:hypothetical protein
MFLQQNIEALVKSWGITVRVKNGVHRLPWHQLMTGIHYSMMVQESQFLFHVKVWVR